MTNESEHDDTIKALEAQLEAAKAKAKIEAMEAELAALKAKDADVAAAASASAEEAERARLADVARAAAAAEEAQAAAVAAAPVPGVTSSASPASPQEPAVVYVERPIAKKSGGLVAALVVILLALVGTLGATYLAIRGDLRGPWAAPAAVATDIVLIAAGDLGPAPARTDAPPMVVFDDLSQPATESAPAPVASLAGIEVSGDTPEIYGLSFAGCSSIDSSNADNAAAVDAFVAAQNADETLGLGTAIPAADYAGFFQHITFGMLLADTRVTYNGYSAGATFPIQAVLQRGTLVGVDRFGVPRVHCGSGVALTSPVTAEGEVTFSGEAWADLDLDALVTVVPASSVQTEFTVLPVGPSNVQTAFSVTSRACSWPSTGSCLEPDDFALAQEPVLLASAPDPVPTECSNWAPGTTDADAVVTRVVNASGSTVQAYMVLSVGEGCGTRHDYAIGAGENLNLSTYWPGTIFLFTDGTSATPMSQYVFGEQTLFVIE